MPGYGVKLAMMSGTTLNCTDGTWDRHGRRAVTPRHHTGPDRIKEYVVWLLPSMQEARWLERPSLRQDGSQDTQEGAWERYLPH
jgi:hypothetical protein